MHLDRQRLGKCCQDETFIDVVPTKADPFRERREPPCDSPDGQRDIRFYTKLPSGNCDRDPCRLALKHQVDRADQVLDQAEGFGRSDIHLWSQTDRRRSLEDLNGFIGFIHGLVPGIDCVRRSSF